jgi:hypothetical protein
MEVEASSASSYEPVYGAFRGLLKSSPHLHNALLPKNGLNIMLPHTPWSPYSSIPIRVSHQNGDFINKFFNLCYMYHQSQKTIMEPPYVDEDEEQRL